MVEVVDHFPLALSMYSFGKRNGSEWTIRNIGAREAGLEARTSRLARANRQSGPNLVQTNNSSLISK